MYIPRSRDHASRVNLCSGNIPLTRYKGSDHITIKVLNCVHVYLTMYLLMCIKTTGCVTNSVDPVQTPHSVVSDLGLHCLLKRDFPNIYGK